MDALNGSSGAVHHPVINFPKDCQFVVQQYSALQLSTKGIKGHLDTSIVLYNSCIVLITTNCDQF